MLCQEASRIRLMNKVFLVCFFPRLLLRISQRSFQMVLVDKQGTDKQRYPFPITAAELFTTIDTFPLRKEEMVLQQEAGQTC